MVFSIPVFVVIGIVLFVYAGKQNIIRLKKFAVSNGLNFIGSEQPVIANGAVFGVGDSRKYVAGFGTDDGKVSFVNYQYTTGSGKSRSTTTWGIMHAKLSRNLPNVVLDAVSNNTFKRFSNLPAGFKGGQKFELEGNFNKYFSVYAPAGYQRDALYFLTPELMQALVDYGSAYDFEVIDDNLYIYKSGSLKLNKEILPHIVQTIKYFRWQFEDNVKRYNDDRVEGAKVANVVSTDGKRLKRGIGWLSIIIFVIFMTLQLLNIFW